MQPITQITQKYDIDETHIEPYGKYKAKLTHKYINTHTNKPHNNKLILVTAINPTPAGEGKTTVTISLTQGLNQIGKKTTAALREPSLGPCFGIKGGASGGGKSCLIPENELNLHFTGDFHAITTANNLISAIIDNHIHHGNELNINPKQIIWKRVLDMNDRTLRNTIIGLGTANGTTREDGFMITVASEIMAILCLATDLNNLRQRLGNIIVAYTYDKKPVHLKELKIVGSLMALLVDAYKPNLIQTTEGNLAIVHGGPFANIAHGCNSVIATRTALSLSEYVVTEAGFGADLGAEKFIDIKCRTSGLYPNAIVIVATIRALKFNGGVDKTQLSTENLEALKNGFPNLARHVENMRTYNVPVCVAINRFATDTDSEIALLQSLCEDFGVRVDVCEGFAKGGEGAVSLAETVVDLVSNHGVSTVTSPCEAVSVSKGSNDTCLHGSQSTLTVSPVHDGDDGRNHTEILEGSVGSGEVDAGFGCGCDTLPARSFPYELEDSIEVKINKLASKFYRADRVDFTAKARKNMTAIEGLGYGNLPICVAKTPYSFSDDPKLLGAPTGFSLTVTDVRSYAGADMVVLELGNVMTMPGLPKRPAAFDIDVDDEGNIVGMI